LDAIEDRLGSCRRRLEALAKGRVLFFQCANPFADARRIGVVAGAIQLAKALLGRKRALAIRGELVTEPSDNSLEIAERLNLRTCVV
jgi:hypothetical protein